MKKPLILFYPNLPLLSKNEMQVLDLLIDAGKLIAPIYSEQEKQAENQINRVEMERAAKKDPSILSPYTVVEKNNGKLVAIPYHVKYAELLKPVSEKLVEASNLTKSDEFRKFLQLKAKSLLDGTYDDAFAAWLRMKPFILDLGIGPFEHLDDKLFFGKASYQAWVGVVDQEGTNKLNNYKKIVLGARRKALVPEQRIDNLDKVKAKTINVVLFSGLMARVKFVGVNLPMDVNFVQKYGSEITIFNQPNDLRIKEQVLPTFNKYFSKTFRQGFSKEDLRRGYLRNVAMHELAHSYLYKHAAANLEELFQPIYEISASVLGFRMAGSLLLKDMITDKQLESMIITYLSRCLYLLQGQNENKSLINYAVSGSVFVNYLMESGALKQIDKMLIPNFMKIFVSIHDLSYILENLLSSGTRRDAETFIKKYGRLNPL